MSLIIEYVHNSEKISLDGQQKETRKKER